MTLTFDGWPRKIIRHLFYTTSSFVHHFKSIVEFKLNLQSGNAQFRSQLAIFCQVWPWNLRNDLGKQYGTSSILHQTLCIISKPWVNSNWSYSLETPNSGKNWRFLSHVTFKFDRWPWKTIGHLFCVASSYVRHFISISEFKLELQSGNSQFGSKSRIILAVWPWTLWNIFQHNFNRNDILKNAYHISKT